MAGFESMDQMDMLHDGLEDGAAEGIDNAMGDGMDDGMGDGLGDEMDLDDSKPITEEDAWTVIAAHFQEKGLVSQQLESYDGFITSTLQVCH